MFSCLSPQAAVDGYRKYLMPFASRASIGAPAVANGPTGLNWMQDFLRLCTGCKIDFVPVHWYGPAGNVQDFYDFVGKANKVAGSRRVWITEVSELDLSAVEGWSLMYTVQWCVEDQ